MALVSMDQILVGARREKRAVGGFAVWSYDSAYAIAMGAKKLNLPVVLINGEFEAGYMGGFENVRQLVERIAETVEIPIVLHADHFRDLSSIIRAMDAGYTSVMIDGSRLPLEQNISLTRKVVEVAKARGVSVEGELGRLAGNEGDEDVTEEEAFQTDPEEAAYFVERTGVDCLAVAIGTVHGAYRFAPKVNITRLQRIAEKVRVPLVMHGGSGTPEDKIAEAIESGIAKINVATDLVTITARKIAEVQVARGFRYNVSSVYEAAREACQAAVEHKMRLFSNSLQP